MKAMIMILTSINDLLNDDTLLPTLMVIFVVVMIVAVPMGIAMGKSANKKIYGEDEQGTVKEENNAKIVARRPSPHPLNQTVMINTVVFELENGNRLEFAIKDGLKYAAMIEGDRGTLRYQGKKFISFERRNHDEA